MSDGNHNLHVTEGVPPEIAVLAQVKELGDIRNAYRPMQRSLFPKGNAARLYLYQGGVVITDPDIVPMVYSFRSTAVFQHLVTVNGAVKTANYALTGPDNRAIVIGRGLSTLALAIPEFDGRPMVTDVHRGGEFRYEGQWGTEIGNGIARAQLPGYLQRLRRGETLDFHRFALSLDGIRDPKRSLSWPEVGKVYVHDGTVRVDSPRGSTLLVASVRAVPNLTLLLTLVNQVRQSNPA